MHWTFSLGNDFLQNKYFKNLQQNIYTLLNNHRIELFLCFNSHLDWFYFRQTMSYKKTTT